ncbi:hypothetical protein SeMB42_g07203 [Synchytrium endobioticum]|uniref:Uncharacterized protein n=1 Tax=Synchytrium endobioticum TaxID=286115 RepID=A0A507CP79_9FUNG|nr:hypothetical protein SeMB42_g07203 [Synchytrium endobioticum]TPX40942.1 hypothetical protein SeLEV6574_g06326 [Synchytrium endobioticum]
MYRPPHPNATTSHRPQQPTNTGSLLGKRPATSFADHANVKRTAYEPPAEPANDDDEFGTIDDAEMETFELVMSQQNPAYTPQLQRPPPFSHRPMTATSTATATAAATAAVANANQPQRPNTAAHGPLGHQSYHPPVNAGHLHLATGDPHNQLPTNINHQNLPNTNLNPQTHHSIGILSASLQPNQYNIDAPNNPSMNQNHHATNPALTMNQSKGRGDSAVPTSQINHDHHDIVAIAHRAQDVNLLTKQIGEYRTEIAKLRQENADLGTKNKHLDAEILTKLGEASMVRTSMTRMEQENKTLKDQLRDHQVKSLREMDAMKKELELQVKELQAKFLFAEHEMKAREYDKTCATAPAPAPAPSTSPAKADPRDKVRFPSMASFTSSPKIPKRERPIMLNTATMTDYSTEHAKSGHGATAFSREHPEECLPAAGWDRSSQIAVSFEHENVLFLRQLLAGPCNEEGEAIFQHGILRRLSLPSTVSTEFANTYTARVAALLENVWKLVNNMTLSLAILLPSLDWMLKSLLQHKVYTPLSCLCFVLRLVLILNQDCRRAVTNISNDIVASLLRIWSLMIPVAYGGSEMVDVDVAFLGSNVLDCLRVLAYEAAPLVLRRVRDTISASMVQMCLDVKQPASILIRTVELLTLLAQDRETFDALFQDTVIVASSRRSSVLDRLCTLMAYSPTDLGMTEADACTLYGAILHQLLIVSLRYNHVPLRIVGYPQNLRRLASSLSFELDFILGLASFSDMSSLPPTTPARLQLVRSLVDLFHTLLFATRHTIAELPLDTQQAIVSCMAKLCIGAPDVPTFEDVAFYATDMLNNVLAATSDGKR